MLELDKISHQTPSGFALSGLHLQIRLGEVVGLVGQSGAGKSLILKIAAGQVRPSRGRIRLEGVDVRGRPLKLRAAVALSTPLLPGPYELSVADWMRYWSTHRGLGGPLAEREREALERFGLADRSTQLVAHLSLGQRRLLDLARVWAVGPKLLLLDAPEYGVDGQGLRLIVRAIRWAQSQRHTVVIATTFPGLPVKVCDRVIHLQDGLIVDERREEQGGLSDLADFVKQAQGWLHGNGR
ncbi:MAG: ABC transporter ATP-binding protein [Myxococcota bacterium]|nr:ABC transporter ATP-binding protein [Myxococcota bacterium]